MPVTVIYDDAQVHQFVTEFHDIPVFYFNADNSPLPRTSFTCLERTVQRGVGIRYISMGPMDIVYDIQVFHPDYNQIKGKIAGESIDIIADKTEALSGIFEKGKIDHSPFIWSRNHWFVTANRDSLRHDFYHYFFDKLYEQGQSLSMRNRQIYTFIKADD